MITRGRVVGREEAATGTPLRVPRAAPRGLPFGRVAPRSLVDASAEASRLVAQARTEAAQLLAAAERQVADLKLRAEAEARAEAAAKLASHALALANHEAKAEERALDRSVALARLLAERLLGASLAAAPEQVVSLARQALGEARGARRLSIVAHPEDAKLLSGSLASLGVTVETVRLVPDASRARGSLRIETDIGVLDADLAPQLDRLALRLRETLANGE
ncbi:MAG TPA: FliH/SctL family protein [Polyangiaceae bacterium]|nr:FliH/SctL family protein [Polyangiaceae bacterium]